MPTTNELTAILVNPSGSETTFHVDAQATAKELIGRAGLDADKHVLRSSSGEPFGPEKAFRDLLEDGTNIGRLSVVPRMDVG